MHRAVRGSRERDMWIWAGPLKWDLFRQYARVLYIVSRLSNTSFSDSFLAPFSHSFSGFPPFREEEVNRA